MLVRGQNSILNEITVEKLVYGGEGLARRDGKVVLTPYVLPGETVRVETLSETKALVRARAVEVLEPAPEREEAFCEYFTRCGGCDYQHLAYEDEVRWKLAILKEVLRRVGKIDPPGEIATETGPPAGYRNRVQLRLEDERLGFRQAGSHKLQPVLQCPVASPRINETLSTLRRMAHQPRFPGFVNSIELFTNENEVQVNIPHGSRRVAKGFFRWLSKSVPGADAPTLDYRAAGETFRVGHRSFFQVNRFLVDRLAKLVLDGVEGRSALDLYAGVGLFSLPLARRCDSVRAVESGKGAVDDLQFNAGRAGVRVETCRDTVERYLESLSSAPECVVADPPRAGLGKAVVNQLVRLRPPGMTIVSCDPATLARDVAGLIGGGYRLEQMTLVDMFPRTYHIETVSVLRS